MIAGYETTSCGYKPVVENAQIHFNSNLFPFSGFDGVYTLLLQSISFLFLMVDLHRASGP